MFSVGDTVQYCEYSTGSISAFDTAHAAVVAVFWGAVRTVPMRQCLILRAFRCSILSMLPVLLQNFGVPSCGYCQC